MGISVDSVLANVKTVLNDAGLVHWTQAELIAWGNEAQTELAKMKIDSATKTTNYTLAPGAKQTNPSGGIKILDIRQNVGGSSVTPCDRKSLDLFQPTWMTTPTASTVKHWMDDEQPNTFYVYPAQGASPATVVVTYSYKPADAAAGGTYDILDIYQAQLQDYILYRAFSKDSEPASAERAVAYYKAFYG